MTETTVLQTDSSSRASLQLRRGLGDIVAGLRHHGLWTFLGWREVHKQYQRSVLGPFWLTLNMAILVGTLGWFYAQVFAQDITEFLPYVAIGFIVWGLIGGLINESCTIFTSAANSVRQARLPLSIYAWQLVWRQLVMFLHNFVIYVLVAVAFAIWPGIIVLTVVPAIVLILLAGFFLALIMGPLAARFRDIPPITASITQVFFFLTPIFWSPSALPERALFLTLNPFYHFLQIVREPLLGRVPGIEHWIACLAMTALLAIFAVFFFSRLRSRIPYWA